MILLGIEVNTVTQLCVKACPEGTAVCSGIQDARIMTWLIYTVFSPMWAMPALIFQGYNGCVNKNSFKYTFYNRPAINPVFSLLSLK